MRETAALSPRSRKRKRADGPFLCLLMSVLQALNEEPHPQVVVALGLRMTKCEPSSPSE